MERAPDKGHLPGNANCLQCHPLDTIPDETNGIRMSHEVHIKLRNLVCADCHDYVSHKKPGQPARVTMELCPMCHNEQGAPDRCDFCHVAPPIDAHRPNYLKEHGKEARLDEAECLRCHHDKKEFCDECHAVPAGAALLGHLAVQPRHRRAEGPRELRSLSHQVLLCPVPPGDAPHGLGDEARSPLRARSQRLPGLPSPGHV